MEEARLLGQVETQKTQKDRGAAGYSPAAPRFFVYEIGQLPRGGGVVRVASKQHTHKTGGPRVNPGGPPHTEVSLCGLSV